MIACQHGEQTIIQELLSADADVHAIDNVSDESTKI